MATSSQSTIEPPGEMYLDLPQVPTSCSRLRDYVASALTSEVVSLSPPVCKPRCGTAYTKDAHSWPMFWGICSQILRLGAGRPQLSNCPEPYCWSMARSSNHVLSLRAVGSEHSYQVASLFKPIDLNAQRTPELFTVQSIFPTAEVAIERDHSLISEPRYRFEDTLLWPDSLTPTVFRRSRHIQHIHIIIIRPRSYNPSTLQACHLVSDATSTSTHWIN